jgi:hypothetical protein
MLATADLDEYRVTHPDWVAQHGSRGLLNWIHDRMWHHAVVLLDGLPGVVIKDSGPTREIGVNSQFRIRMKMHSHTGAIRNFPTQSALQFISQDGDMLFGLTTINLTAGHEWEADLREMLGPVLSLRDGSFEDPIWLIDLPTSGIAGTGTVLPITPDSDLPGTPAIAVPSLDDTKQKEEGDIG